MVDLGDLIAKLARAEEGAGSLDREIRAALGEPSDLPEGAYSSSIDAALRLLPEAGYWELICISNDGLTQFACELHPADNRAPIIGLGRTGALAIATAALKARNRS